MKGWQMYLAEFVGTFSLVLAVSLSLVFNFPLATPIVAGLTLMLAVYSIGAVSGAHLNPAVTIALASVKKIGLADAAVYILVQFAAAFAAMGVVYAMSGDTVSVGAVDSGAVFLGEALGAFFLVWGISAVVSGKVKDAASGLAIGGSLLLGVLVASGVSNGVLNPAVAVGIGSVSWVYVVAPIVGSLVAAWLYRAMVAK